MGYLARDIKRLLNLWHVKVLLNEWGVQRISSQKMLSYEGVSGGFYQSLIIRFRVSLIEAFKVERRLLLPLSRYLF